MSEKVKKLHPFTYLATPNKDGFVLPNGRFIEYLIDADSASLFVEDETYKNLRLTLAIKRRLTGQETPHLKVDQNFYDQPLVSEIFQSVAKRAAEKLPSFQNSLNFVREQLRRENAVTQRLESHQSLALFFFSMLRLNKFFFPHEIRQDNTAISERLQEDKLPFLYLNNQWSPIVKDYQEILKAGSFQTIIGKMETTLSSVITVKPTDKELFDLFQFIFKEIPFSLYVYFGIHAPQFVKYYDRLLRPIKSLVSKNLANTNNLNDLPTYMQWLDVYKQHVTPNLRYINEDESTGYATSQDTLDVNRGQSSRRQLWATLERMSGRNRRQN